MILLDSNALIYLSKGMLDIESFFSETEEYAISIITYMEVLGYDFLSQKEEEIVRKLLSLFQFVYIDEEIMNTVIYLRKKYKMKLPDAIICATCLVNQAVLMTNDVKLNTISEIKIKNVNI